MSAADLHATSRGWRQQGVARPGLVWTAGLIGLVLALPVLSVALAALSWPGEALAHLAETVLGGYVLNTLYLSVLVLIGVTVLGTASAWLTTMYAFPGRSVLSFALALPLAAPAYAVAYAYADLLQAAGPVQALWRESFGAVWFPEIRSLPGAALVLTLVLYPYVYLFARAAFVQQSVCALDAARMLGRTRLQAFAHVALPMARPAIAAGAALALMETLADFGTVAHFGVPTFTTGIYRAWFSLGDHQAAAQLSAMLLMFAVGAIGLERAARRGRGVQDTTNRYRDLPLQKLGGARAAGAMMFCAALPVLGFVIPALVLIESAAGTGGSSAGPRFWSAAFNSLTLALAAAALILVLALTLALARRAARHGVTRLAHHSAALGYAVPGSVIAIGVMMPLAAFDRTVDGFWRESFGSGTGLILTGGVTGLLFAYAVRFMAPALNGIEAGLARLTASIEGAAQLLTRSPREAFLRVHVPMIAPAALTALLVVFVDVMKELPATLLLRPFNADTLAVLAHTYAADERLDGAALPALAIVAFGLIPVILLMRQSGRARPGA